jgi:outer membrane protein assembly factor BamE (lipoprotein component of BamABCDE complex)
MKKILLFFVLILSVSALAGCAASMGNSSIKNESNNTLSQKLIKGKTTESQVVQMFGQPESKSFAGNGDPIWSYSRNTERNGVLSYVPIVGLFANAQTDTNKVLAILFNKKGIIKNWTWTNSTNHLNAGF